MTLRVFSSGGGVQSTAALVLAVQKKIDFPIFLFCNVGDDSEHPATLEYVRNVAMPYAAANGIEFHELHRIKKDGTIETIVERMTRAGSKTFVIPMRFGANGAPGKRNCTSDFKVEVIAKWQKQHGATKTDPAICGLGISIDEWQRVKTDSGIAWQTLNYPLIDLRLTRQDCMNIIERAGLPIPPKSSCFFCPYHNTPAWRELKAQTPDLFDRAANLEESMTARNIALGHGPVYLTRFAKPLRVVYANTQTNMFDEAVDDNCEDGYCMV